MSTQKNGPARVEATGGGVHRRALRHQSTSGLSDCSTPSQRELLSVRQRPQDGAAWADARAGPGACSLRLPPPARTPATRGLVFRPGAGLSAVLRGKPAIAQQAASTTEDGGWQARAV